MGPIRIAYSRYWKGHGKDNMSGPMFGDSFTVDADNLKVELELLEMAKTMFPSRDSFRDEFSGRGRSMRLKVFDEDGYVMGEVKLKRG